jgi:oligopeptide/dipeptide ABC transporter ATP-binding protein
MTHGALSVRGLKKHFPYKKGLSVRAVDGIDLDLGAGESLGLVGESGSGKSTVAYTVVGMYRPTAGELRFNGRDISQPAARRPLDLKGEIQIVFQDPGSSLNPRRTIRKILEDPLRWHAGRKRAGYPDSAEELMALVGLPEESLGKHPASLGGGERQLVAIARALAARPSLVILDEPTSALDVSVQAKVINRLLDLQKMLGLSYLFITHDLSLMRNVVQRVAIMYLGKICEQARTADFFQRPFHPYTRMLLSSIPVVSEAEEGLKPRKVVSSGEIPSPVHVPPGCSFHLRCPEGLEICPRADPGFTQIADAHRVRCHLACTQPGEITKNV